MNIIHHTDTIQILHAAVPIELKANLKLDLTGLEEEPAREGELTVRPNTLIDADKTGWAPETQEFVAAVLALTDASSSDFIRFA